MWVSMVVFRSQKGSAEKKKLGKRFFRILYFYLCLGCAIDHLPWGLPTKTLRAPFLNPIPANVLPISLSFLWSWSPPLCCFLLLLVIFSILDPSIPFCTQILNIFSPWHSLNLCDQLLHHHILITNLMRWLLFIYKILYSSICFEP